MKKSFILIFFLAFLSINLFAQNNDLKYYSNWSTGFEGYALARYYGNISETDYKSDQELMNDIKEKCSEQFTEAKKITKKNDWLFKQAMNEWDYEKGEVYVVVCSDSKYSNNALIVFVIVRDKDDFLWSAYPVDLDKEYDPIF